VTRESAWRIEWAALRAERDRARRKWRGAADGLAARARDPLGLGKLAHDHPIAAGGVGAAVGALLVNLLLGRARASKRDADGAADAPQASAWSVLLRDAALNFAVPWLLRMLERRFGGKTDPAASPIPEGPSPSAAASRTNGSNR